MANEIWTSFQDGAILYCPIFKRNDGKVFDQFDGGDTFVDYADIDIGRYDVPLTPFGTTSDLYAVNFPAIIITASVYYITIFEQDSVTPATPDVDADEAIAQGVVYWDGVAESDLATVTTEVEKTLYEFERVDA